MTYLTPYISLEDMDNITQSILSDYEIDVENITEAIPIEEIIEFHFDLSVSWENIDDLSQGEHVMAAIFPSEKQIVMNENKLDLFKENEGFMNFTFAHELGHWVLHTADDTQLSFDLNSNKHVFYCRSTSKKLPVETQADMFASSILMPKPFVVSFISDLWNQERVQWNDLYQLCELLHVSISALIVRLEQLKLLYVEEKKIYESKEEAMGQASFDF